MSDVTLFRSSATSYSYRIGGDSERPCCEKYARQNGEVPVSVSSRCLSRMLPNAQSGAINLLVSSPSTSGSGRGNICWWLEYSPCDTIAYAFASLTASVRKCRPPGVCVDARKRCKEHLRERERRVSSTAVEPCTLVLFGFVFL